MNGAMDRKVDFKAASCFNRPEVPPGISDNLSSPDGMAHFIIIQIPPPQASIPPSSATRLTVNMPPTSLEYPLNSLWGAPTRGTVAAKLWHFIMSNLWV